MKLYNSVCTTLVFPESRKSLEEFRRMSRHLADMGMHYVEFYHDGPDKAGIGNALSDAGIKGVYIGVIPSKEKKRYLCDEDEDARRSAVELFKGCVDEAQSWGIQEVMANSGRITRDIEKGLDNLARSMEEVYEYAAKKNYDFKLLIEPCDTHMDACHLIGDYRRSVSFVKAMNDAGYPLKLTMDSAHTAEEGEDFVEAVTAARPYCNHIHFANCRISDPGDALYGDKHIGYEYADSVWTPQTLSSLFAELEKLYPGDDELRIGLEVLCRTGEPYSYYQQLWDSLPFLHPRNI